MSEIITQSKLDESKEIVETIAQVDTANSDQSKHHSDTDAILASFTPAEEKKIMRKVDLYLVPMLGALYLVSLLDRTNLGAAAIAGMTKELHLAVKVGVDRYGLIALVFFITYTLFQPPATIATRFFGPRLFLPTIAMAWGATIIGFGFVHSWTVLVPLRLVLGVLEAGLFPGTVYLLSTWYVRREVGKRYAAFYFFGMLTNAFGGVLAFGLMQMKGLASLSGWRWIFIVEGLLTCVIAVLGYLFVLGFPDKRPFSLSGQFLNPQQLQFVLARVEKDRADAIPEPFSMKKWLQGAADFKIWLFALAFMDSTSVGYSLAFFLPSILREDMGFDVGTAQCLVAPPYVFAALVMIVTSWLSDKFQKRGPFIIFNSMMGLVGLCMTGFAKGTATRYAGVFLGCAGANSNIPLLMTWQANNIRGQWKRAFCSATLVGFGGIGGIIGTTVFRSKDAPQYLPGLGTCAGLCGMMGAIGAVLMTYFYFQNRAQARGKVLESLEGFRYIL